MGRAEFNQQEENSRMCDDLAMQKSEDAKYGPDEWMNKSTKYKATQFWNEVIRAFYSQLPVRRHRWKLRMIDGTFTVSEAVDWLCEFLRQKSHSGHHVPRENALRLLEKFYQQGIFVEAFGDFQSSLKDDASILFRFRNLSPSKIARTPLALKQQSSAQLSRDSVEFNSSPFVASKSQKNAPPVTPLRYRKINADIESNTLPRKSDKRSDDNFPALPEMHLVARSLSPEEIEHVWKNCVLKRLDTLMHWTAGGIACPINMVETVNGADVMTNAKGLSVAAGSSSSAKDVPPYIMQAMKCLAKWPWRNATLNWPVYPGFERDVFRTILDFFRDQSPLLSEAFAEIFFTVFTRAEHLDVGNWEKQTGLLLTTDVCVNSQRSIEYLVEQVKCGSPDVISKLFEPSPKLNRPSKLRLSNREFHVETEFSSKSPVTRLYVPQSQVAWAEGTIFRPESDNAADAAPNSHRSSILASGDVELSGGNFRNSFPGFDSADEEMDIYTFLLSERCVEEEPRAGGLAPLLEANSGRSLSDSFERLPGLLKSPGLLAKLSQKSLGDQTSKADNLASMPGYRNVARNRASLATLQPSQLHALFANGNMSGDDASGYAPAAPGGARASAQKLRQTYENPRCRHSVATSSFSHFAASLRQPFAPPPLASHRLSMFDGSYGNFDSEADLEDHVTSSDHHVTSSGDARALSASNASSGFISMPGLDVAVEALQLACLLLPPKARRRLHLMLRLMAKVSVNHCLKLDPLAVKPNRAIVLDAFASCLASSSKPMAQKLLAFLLDHHVKIFARPDDLIRQVDRRMEEAKRSKVTYLAESAENLRFCEQISSRQFAAQGVAQAESALMQLLDVIVSDENLGEAERKRRLKKFRQTYPALYAQRFPKKSGLPKKKSSSLLRTNSNNPIDKLLKIFS